MENGGVQQSDNIRAKKKWIARSIGIRIKSREVRVEKDTVGRGGERKLYDVLRAVRRDDYSTETAAGLAVCFDAVGEPGPAPAFPFPFPFDWTGGDAEDP